MGIDDDGQSRAELAGRYPWRLNILLVQRHARPSLTKASQDWSASLLRDSMLKGIEPFATFPPNEKRALTSIPVIPLALNSSTVDFAFELLLGAPVAIQPVLGVPYRSTSASGTAPQPFDPVRKDGLSDLGRFESGVAQLPHELGRFRHMSNDGEPLMAESRVALAFLDRAVMVGGCPSFTFRSTGNVAGTKGLSEMISVCLEMAPVPAYDERVQSSPPDLELCEKAFELIVSSGGLGSPELCAQVLTKLESFGWQVDWKAFKDTMRDECPDAVSSASPMPRAPAGRASAGAQKYAPKSASVAPAPPDDPQHEVNNDQPLVLVGDEKVKVPAAQREKEPAPSAAGPIGSPATRRRIVAQEEWRAHASPPSRIDYSGPHKLRLPPTAVSRYASSGGEAGSIEDSAAASYWECLAAALQSLMPAIDYDFEHTIVVSEAKGCDWVSGHREYHMPGVDFTTPLTAERTAMDRMRNLINDRVAHDEAGVKISGTVTIWARSYALDDPRTVCVDQDRAAKQQQVDQASEELERLESQSCCGDCCNSSLRQEIRQAAERLRELELELNSIKERLPWHPLKLTDAEEVAKAWSQMQPKLFSQFEHHLMQLQRRVSGTIGFTLRDEWRYLRFDKKAVFINSDRDVYDEHPLKPQVVNPRPRCWDKPWLAEVESFGTADLETRLPLHGAFRNAFATATAMSPINADGLVHSGDSLRFEGNAALHMPTKIRIRLDDGALVKGIHDVTVELNSASEICDEKVECDVPDNGVVTFTNPKVPLFPDEVERMRGRSDDLKVIGVSSVSCWLAMAFSGYPSDKVFRSNIRLRRRLLAIANHGKIKGGDSLVTEDGKEGGFRSVSGLITSGKRLFNRASSRLPFRSGNKQEKYKKGFYKDCECRTTVEVNCESISGTGWGSDKGDDDLLFVRESQTTLYDPPTEPRRKTIKEFEGTESPKEELRTFQENVMNYENNLARWYIAKDRYDEYMHWLYLTDTIGEAALRLQCIEQRLYDAAWARYFVLQPSKATGSWKQKVLGPTNPTFNIPMLTKIPFYCISRESNTSWKWPAPPPTWGESQVKAAVECAKAEEERQRRIKEETTLAARKERDKEARAAKEANRLRQLIKDQNKKELETQASMHEKNAKGHARAAQQLEALARQAAKEEKRQCDLAECLPLIREAQVYVDKLRSQMREIVDSTREHFVQINNEAIKKHSEWAAVTELQEQCVPKAVLEPFTLESNEGFDSEISKLRKYEKRIRVVLGSFAHDVDTRIEPRHKEHSEYSALIAQLLNLPNLDNERESGVRDWLKDVNWQSGLPHFPPDIQIDPQRLKEQMLPAEDNSGQEQTCESGDYGDELERVNEEALAIAINSVQHARIPFDAFYLKGTMQWSLDSCFFVKPRLLSKATSLRLTSAEPDEPDDADDDTSMVSAAEDGHDVGEHEETNYEGNSAEDEGEVNETTAQESLGSTRMFYPAHIGLQAAIGYHLNFVLPSEVQTSLVGKHLPKWIFVKQHRYRLWYCERAEWFHPMFCPQAVEKRSVVDILNAEGISRSAVKNLYKKFKDLDFARPGGFTCNLCSKKVEPSEMILWDQYNQKEKKVSSEYNPSRVRSKATLEMAMSNCDPGLAPARDCLPVMKRVCQGYFCHHREMNGEALKLFNRCFSVCMECAMEQHLTYTPSSSDAIDEPDVELRGDLMRPRLRLRQPDYAQRLVRIEEDFKTKCFTAEALKRGAPAGTPWYVLADAALALVGTVPTQFAAPLERVGGSGEAVRVGALDTVGGLSIQALETPLELDADELTNELAIGQPQFVGTIGTFPAFARSQCYYFQEFVPNESDPARSRHPFSKGDGYLEVVQAREKKENKRAANSFSGALDVLIDALFKAESNARAKNVSQDGQYWRLVMEGVKSGALSKKDRDELREAFLSSNGHVLQPSEGVITRGGGIEAELRPETAMDKDVLSKPQSSVELNFFAVSVASFFYSRTRAKEQWVVDASAIEADKEEKLKMAIENQAHAAELSKPDEEPSDKQVEQWQERVASGVSEIIEMTEPPNGPLACKEVPQFVRDVINVKYPLRIDEIEFKLIGVEEVDVLFYHAAQPLKFVSSALHDIASAMRGALSACYFGDSQEGEYEELLTTSGSPYRRRKYSGAAPSIEIALRNLRQALMVRATSCALEDKHKPSWCPPNFEPKSMDLGTKKIEYANLSFCRFHLESDDADAINPNEDLLDAISKFELWWSLNMQMYKVMGLQREYILFFSACVSTDQERFANTVATHFGVDKDTGDASQSLKNATAALIQNIDAMKQMKEEVTAVIRHCNKGMSAVYKELREWGMEWEKKEMRRAPTTVSSVVPFIIEITRSSE
ncbi:hypothetical protein AB1Y20_021572 [Prymnesium parvum]|uniref:Uncharacterized protein n=1 Tax=Prymnesium parvum TaxID=97485 RepID=A0AB34JJ21_PRYPA